LAFSSRSLTEAFTRRSGNIRSPGLASATDDTNEASEARSGSYQCHGTASDRGILALAGHGDDANGPVFHPVTNNRMGEPDHPLYPGSVHHNIVRKYGLETVFTATAVRNALSHEAGS
jgi:hypothetical protein